MVAARHEESVLFSIADLQVLEVQRRREQGARVKPKAPRPQLVVNHPPPAPLVQGEALPRNRSFWPVLLVTGLVLLGGVAAAVIVIARNTEVLTVAEPSGRAAVAPVSPTVPQVEKLAPAPSRPVETRLARPRTEARSHRAATSTKRRARRKAAARRRARRRRTAARRRRSRRRRRRQVAAIARPAISKPTPAPSAPAPKKPLPTIDELIAGGVR